MTIAEIKAKTIEDNTLYDIETLKVIIRSGHVISYITEEEMLKIVNRYCSEDQCTPGLFICESNGRFCVCDGDCECYCEDYKHESIAIRWLIGDYCSLEELIAADK